MEVILSLVNMNQINHDNKEEKKGQKYRTEDTCAILQGILDENKEKLTDDVYLKLCNVLMEQSRKENRYSFYECYYSIAEPMRVAETKIHIKQLPEKRILRIDNELYGRWKTETRDNEEKEHYSLYVYLTKCLKSILNTTMVLKNYDCHQQENMTLEVVKDCHLISYTNIDCRE